MCMWNGPISTGPHVDQIEYIAADRVMRARQATASPPARSNVDVMTDEQILRRKAGWPPESDVAEPTFDDYLATRVSTPQQPSPEETVVLIRHRLQKLIDEIDEFFPRDS